MIFINKMDQEKGKSSEVRSMELELELVNLADNMEDFLEK